MNSVGQRVWLFLVASVMFLTRILGNQRNAMSCVAP
jgi:hypothetical protein